MFSLIQNVIPDFSVPNLLLRSLSDQDNLTPSLFHSSLLSHLCWIIRVSFPIPIQSPTSDHSGPNPHQMLTQQSNTVPKTSSTLQSPLLKSSVALNTSYNSLQSSLVRWQHSLLVPKYFCALDSLFKQLNIQFLLFCHVFFSCD